MNFEIINSRTAELYKVKPNSSNFLKKVLKNASKVKAYANKQCESKNITRRSIEDVLERINGAHNVERKKFHLTKFSNEEINKRRELHNKAKEAFAEAAERFYVANQISKQYAGNCKRQLDTFIRNMSSSPDEEIRIYNLISEYQNSNDEMVKSANREELKKFFTVNVKKCKEALEGFNGQGTDEELIEFYKKNNRILNTTSEMQSGSEGHFLEHIEQEFGFVFDNNLAKEYGEKYSQFGVDATLICNKVHAIANPLYPEVDMKDMACAYRLFADLPESISFRSEVGRLAYNMTIPDHESPIKNDLNAFNGYGKVSDSLSPSQTQEFMYGKDIPEELLYDNQISKLKNHLTFALNSRGYEGKSEDFEFYDKNGYKVQSENAFIRMVKGESLLVADKVSSNFIMEASSDPNRTFGFLKANNDYKVTKMKGMDDVLKENDQLLKDLETAKYKKEHAWFNFTRNRYQKQIDEISGKLAGFKTKFNTKVNSNINKKVHDMIIDVNNNILLKDTDKNLFENLRREVNSLTEVHPSNTKAFQNQLSKIDKAASDYISAKIESGEFENNVNFQNRISLVSNIKEACYDFKSLTNELNTLYNENVDKMNQVQPGLSNRIISIDEPVNIEVHELNEDIFMENGGPLIQIQENQKDRSLE